MFKFNVVLLLVTALVCQPVFAQSAQGVGQGTNTVQRVHNTSTPPDAQALHKKQMEEKAEAQANAATNSSDPCASHWQNLKKRDPKDPCTQAKLYKEAKMHQMVAAGVYGATAAICGLACVNIATPFANGVLQPLCGGAGIAAAATDTAAAIHFATTVDKDIRGHFDEGQLVSVGLGGGIVAGAGISAMAVSLSDQVGQNIATQIAQKFFDQGVEQGVTGSTTQTTSTMVGENTTEVVTKETAKEASQRWLSGLMSCIVAGTSAAQAMYRGYMVKDAMTQEQKAKTKKRQVMSEAAVIQASESSGSAGSASTAAPVLAGAPSSVDNSKDSSEEALKKEAQTLAAKAREIDKKGVFDNFEKLSGKPTSELFENLLRMDNPNGYVAAVETADNVYKGEALNKAMVLNEEVKPILDGEMQKFLAGKSNSGQEFASSAQGARTPSNSKSAGLDFGGLLGGLLGNKDKKEDGSKAGEAKFGVAENLKNNEGFHDPDKSLFNVVSQRYTTVSKPFLAGETVVAGAASESVAPPVNQGRQGASIVNPYSR